MLYIENASQILIVFTVHTGNVTLSKSSILHPYHLVIYISKTLPAHKSPHGLGTLTEKLYFFSYIARGKVPNLYSFFTPAQNGKKMNKAKST